MNYFVAVKKYFSLFAKYHIIIIVFIENPVYYHMTCEMYKNIFPIKSMKDKGYMYCQRRSQDFYMVGEAKYF